MLFCFFMVSRPRAYVSCNTFPSGKSWTLFFFFLIILFFISGGHGSSLLCLAFLQLWRAGATLRHGSWASHPGSFSCTGSKASGVSARGLNSYHSQTPGYRLHIVAHRLRCSPACGIFLGQGSNPCLLHQQSDSLPLSHQGTKPQDPL